MLEDFLQEDFLQEAFFLVGLFVAWPCGEGAIAHQYHHHGSQLRHQLRSFIFSNIDTSNTFC